jgi:hypothetical protein
MKKFLFLFVLLLTIPARAADVDHRILQHHIPTWAFESIGDLGQLVKIRVIFYDGTSDNDMKKALVDAPGYGQHYPLQMPGDEVTWWVLVKYDQIESLSHNPVIRKIDLGPGPARPLRAQTDCEVQYQLAIKVLRDIDESDFMKRCFSSPNHASAKPFSTLGGIYSTN